jgi:hypothetical protein
MKLIYKDFSIKLKQVDRENYTIRAVFSLPIEDRQGEIIDQTGWVIDEFLKNPVVLFAHDHHQPAIGKVIELAIVDGNLEGVIQFAVEEYDFAATIFRLYAGGYMRAFSVSFANIEQETNETGKLILKKNLLYEISAVNVPAQALALAKSKGIDISAITAKSVVPFRAYDPLDEGVDWDSERSVQEVRRWAGGPDPADIDFTKYKEGFAWYDSEAIDNVGSYKLPHHYVLDGELKTVWLGVASAMAALLGARGGVDIPENEREAVYNHLAKHYKQFDKEVPELKSQLPEEIKISDTSREVLERARQTLDEILSSDKRENKGQKPLTSQGGLRKRVLIRTLNKAVRSLLNEKRKINQIKIEHEHSRNNCERPRDSNTGGKGIS